MKTKYKELFYFQPHGSGPWVRKLGITKNFREKKCIARV